jgi:hypothetical protein
VSRQAENTSFGTIIWVLFLLELPLIGRFWGRRRAFPLLLLDLPLRERFWGRSKVASALLLLDVSFNLPKTNPLTLRTLFTSENRVEDNNKVRRTVVLADLRPVSSFLDSIVEGQ